MQSTRPPQQAFPAPALPLALGSSFQALPQAPPGAGFPGPPARPTPGPKAQTQLRPLASTDATRPQGEQVSNSRFQTMRGQGMVVRGRARGLGRWSTGDLL